MTDQLSLVDLSAEQEGNAREQVRTRVRVALAAEVSRIVTELGTVINDRDLTGYIDSAAALLTSLVPHFDRETWVDRYGNYVGTPPCQPDDCCGWCSDCETCHGDGDDEVCNMGHCHECDHVCES